MNFLDEFSREVQEGIFQGISANILQGSMKVSPKKFLLKLWEISREISEEIHSEIFGRVPGESAAWILEVFSREMPKEISVGILEESSDEYPEKTRKVFLKQYLENSYAIFEGISGKIFGGSL